MPTRRRISARPRFDKVATSWPNMVIRPRVGRSDRNSRRSSVVLPEPDGPVRNWNEFSGTSKVTSRSTSGPMP